eukprot:GHVU01231531.1.p3 GENE.GHVU01231531.1~~GHVU01231531.1.p3  ORF type:complete len:148 (-),score=17.02 GHVU01231531.1:1901-2344(-)
MYSKTPEDAPLANREDVEGRKTVHRRVPVLPDISTPPPPPSSLSSLFRSCSRCVRRRVKTRCSHVALRILLETVTTALVVVNAVAAMIASRSSPASPSSSPPPNHDHRLISSITIIIKIIITITIITIIVYHMYVTLPKVEASHLSR